MDNSAAQSFDQQVYGWSRRLWHDQTESNFIDELRDAVLTDVLPYADDIDRRDIYPVEPIKHLARKGFTSLTLDTKWGGRNASFEQCAAVFEEASYASAAVGISLITILQA